MSIRAIAKDLYSVQRRVHQLEDKLEKCRPAEELILRGQLQEAQRELSLLKRIMEGEKESGDFRRKFKGFGL